MTKPEHSQGNDEERKSKRLYFLRHTFSVHALEQMIHKGMDLYCLLPILSTYLRHKGIELTEKQLRLTKRTLLTFCSSVTKMLKKIFSEV